MSGAVVNCKKCRIVFKKRASELCPDCIKLEDKQFQILYRALQKSGANGGIAIDDLSSEVGIPIEDIEKFYREGRLSTAASFLKTPCQSCGVLVGETERSGRYCTKCGEIAATKAGVEIKSLQALEKEAAQEHARQQQMSLLKKKDSTPANKSFRSFGAYRQR